MKAKLKKERFKWENLFGKQTLMYEVWLAPLDTSFHQNGKDFTLLKKHTKQDIIGWKIKQVQKRITLFAELTLRSTMINFLT